ncbi:MAG: hypothetical protein JWR60_62 [Polaromonas sp.]|nr:hypothetical protein [Polaromonas sp.]
MLKRKLTKKLTSWFLVLGVVAALPALAAERYLPSADEQEITDSRTGLVWRRCAEGMSWKGGTCAEQAMFLNHFNATAHAAKVAAAAGQPWRLPTMKELSGIASVRDAEDGKAAINPAAFPATPLTRFWSSSAVGRGYFMYVSFVEGSAGEGERNSAGATRLVRSSK